MVAETEAAECYPQVRAAMRVAGGAWTREVALTLALAALTGITLDENTLIYADVRDLMALQRRLRRAVAAS
jgi:hypothetical protein